MNILEHNNQGATIKLDQRELLLAMALVHEGRVSFDCNTDTAKGLDELFNLANLLVEESRRRSLRIPTARKRIHLVAAPIAAQGHVAPHG